MHLLRVVAFLLLAAAAVAASENDAWAMRWRVCADYTAGYTFRYPYDYQPPHQYKTELSRGFSARGMESGELITIKTSDGKEVMAFVPSGPSRKFDIKAFSYKASELPSNAAEPTLAGVGNAIVADEGFGLEAGAQLTWQSFDYYQNPEKRPFADAKWAAPGLEASLGESADACGLVVKHGDRFSGVICAGKLDDNENRAILDTFEILALPKGAKDARSWREAQTYLNKVLDADGRPVPANPTKPVSWSRSWELETQHYHVTSHVSPRRLIEYGAFLESLYKVYARTYDPDDFPPYKMEVHILNTQDDFMTASAAKGFPVGSSVGGFFVPGLLSIYAFEDTKGAHFTADFTVEKVLAHECSHQFLHVTCNGSANVPTWVNEGLAVYFESGEFSKASKDFVLQPPRGRINLLKSLYGKSKDTLWPMDNYLKHRGHITPEQYGEVYAMVHFWIFGATGGLKYFKQYWQALKNGEDGTEAFERVFMADLVKAHGSRDKALEVWQKMMVDYVLKKLK